jgi:hypothetical protein
VTAIPAAAAKPASTPAPAAAPAPAVTVTAKSRGLKSRGLNSCPGPQAGQHPHRRLHRRPQGRRHRQQRWRWRHPSPLIP